MQLPLFAGGNAPEQAENWLMELEKSFVMLNLDDNEMVSLAIF